MKNILDHALNHSQTKYFKCRELNCGVEVHTKGKIFYYYLTRHGIKSVKGYSFEYECNEADRQELEGMGREAWAGNIY
ncbi:hypothetical protein CAEBREN_12008 [Caenorhabditis brenneri]|uniref:Uncharacterized protein n=1 Tax=Caenorhabditis brenneri TaxID=135651 RepID=G0N1P0_CAEBE|nr:hypothetical protein CAEBREN_12008 [Caenorhabditis brenneri]